MEISRIFLPGLLSSSMNGGGKKIPILVEQIFVTSNLSAKLFVHRKAAFCWCWYLWMEDSLPVIYNLSSANIRLLTLVMTTWGKGLLGGFVTFFLRSNTNASRIEWKSTFAKTVAHNMQKRCSLGSDPLL